MTDDERALRLAVAAHPEEQAPRDMLRDLWDEQGDPRGEFARAQEELLARGYPSPKFVRPHELAVRERDLLAAHERAFRCVPCDVCAFLKPGASLRQDCPACDGTGDVGGLERLRVPENSGESIYRHPVTWERGHVVAVRCELGEVVELEDSEGTIGRWERWQPTPWALAVCRWHPVRAFEVTDRRPLRRVLDAGHEEWGWSRPAGPNVELYELPEPVFETLDGGRAWSFMWRVYDGEQEARDALHRRLAAFVRASSAGVVPIKNL